MSKSALSFLILTVMSIAVGLLLPAQAVEGNLLAKIAVGVFASLFVGALVVGRRIKFDPVLR
ncbi:PA3371 family protein [uncultured Pseudomonas sp.]|uniref:PA3371 family protein n=1 Tax=uncultured Pseudomonas sp. TaxID=114707 RepID=UPI0025EF3347|nr:PA3371 family protein [uncultured Pseudomonas sp.]